MRFTEVSFDKPLEFQFRRISDSNSYGSRAYGARAQVQRYYRPAAGGFAFYKLSRGKKKTAIKFLSAVLTSETLIPPQTPAAPGAVAVRPSRKTIKINSSAFYPRAR